MNQRIGKFTLAAGLALASSAQAANENAQAFSNAFQAATSSGPSGSPPPLAEYVFATPLEEQQALAAELSGDAYGTFTSSIIASDLGLLSSPIDNLRENILSGSTQPAMWVRASTGRQRIDGDNNAAQVKTDHDDAVIGGDIPLPGEWRVGGAFGYGQANSTLNGRNAKVDTDSQHYSLYGGRDFALGGHTLILDFGSSYSRHQLDSRRSINTSAVNTGTSADYGLTTTQFSGEAAYNIAFDKKGYIEPFFGLVVLNQRSDSFSEKGDPLIAARIRGQNSQLINNNVGARGRQLFQVAGRDLLLKGNVTWRHLQGDLQPELTVQINGLAPFEVEGTTLPKDSVMVQLKADYSITRNFILDVDYNGAVGSGLNAHEIALNAHWKM